MSADEFADWFRGCGWDRTNPRMAAAFEAIMKGFEAWNSSSAVVRWRSASATKPVTLQPVLIWGVLGDEHRADCHEGYLATNGRDWHAARGFGANRPMILSQVKLWAEMPRPPTKTH